MVNMLVYPNLLASYHRPHQKEPCCGRRMSPKRWILLLIFYISYLMFGASIYYHIEHNLEKDRRAEQLKERIEINEYLLEQLGDENKTTQNEVLQKITEYCGKPVTDYKSDEHEIPYTWTFYHSFFFAFTVCSTVGYGNIAPTSNLGRMIVIVYSVIGIPINGILFAGLGEYFAGMFYAIYRRYKKYKLSTDIHYVPPQLGLITIVAIALVPGITLFLLLPSLVFSYFEGWPYIISFYYSYITTTTIGFGDFVPTFQPHQPREFGAWFMVYEVFIIVWFIFALGYLLMLMTFITRGLQSKKLARLEQQLSTNIKATQNRIWNGVTKDVGYLRRILNELYIIKFKPVYTEADVSQSLYRSVSCPELSMYRVDPPHIAINRKRAFSECYDVLEVRADGLLPVHASSDTELDKIDKEKSFENAEAFRQTTGLLAKVVTALASIKPPTTEDTTLGAGDMYGGYHGFSDSQILASEWSFPSAHEPPRSRGRACSDFNINPMWQMQRPAVQHNEWTWSGDNNQIQQAINDRFRQNNREHMYRSNAAQPPQDYIVNMEDEELRRQRPKKFSIPESLRKVFPFKKRPSQETITTTDTVNGNRKFSIVSVPETQQHRAPHLDYYSTVTANASPTYFQNGKAPLPTLNDNQAYASDTSISSRLSSLAHGRRGSVYDAAEMPNTALPINAYQQKGSAAMPKKRRESIFTQNPAFAATNRRASVFPPNSAAALTQRRGSLSQRRGSSASVSVSVPPQRGGNLPLNVGRRPSMFTATSEEDLSVLENTTVADLIRALEVMHTQVALNEAAAKAQAEPYTELGGVFQSDTKQRKMGTAGLDQPELPSLLSLFGDNTRTLTATAANRLYSRRSTIVGTLPSSPLVATAYQAPTAAGNVLTRRRQSSMQIVDPPPSYSEKEPTPAHLLQQPVLAPGGATTKFKRRFSIRPTALQIPPGKAPPPGVNINNMSSITGTTAASTTPAVLNLPTTASQTALQRRLSLRPSPLAREPNMPAQLGPGSTDTSGTSSSATGASANAARLLSLPPGMAPRPSNTTSSTHSPLSRIVQISQAQRKNSMPERAKKPDVGT